MIEVSGFGGELFFVSDPTRFRVPLVDCGDGWEWRAKEAVWWEAGTVQVFQEPRCQVEVDEVHATGRVSLHRCHKGKSLWAEGEGRLLSLAAKGKWRLQIPLQVGPPTLTGNRKVEYGDPVAVLTETKRNSEVASEPVLARLTTPGGCYQGLGTVSDTGGVLHVHFMEGVVHGPL